MFKGINKVIRAYIYWDFVINSAWGLLVPVFAIFLLQKVSGGDPIEAAKVAGFATLAYWIPKSLLQIPIGHYLDKNHGEVDDFWCYLIGTVITGVVPFGFLFSVLPWQIYLLQAIHAVGMAMIIPSSYAIFIRHVDKGREAYESSVDSTFLGVGAGVAGAVGGVMVGYLGFDLIFILIGVSTMLSVFFLAIVRDEMLPRVPRNIHDLPVGKDNINV